MIIDGPLWFIGALVICGVHALYIRGWRRDHHQYLTWWQRYDAQAQQRHDEFMRVMDRENGTSIEWNLDGNRTRGQA